MGTKVLVSKDWFIKQEWLKFPGKCGLDTEQKHLQDFDSNAENLFRIYFIDHHLTLCGAQQFAAPYLCKELWEKFNEIGGKKSIILKCKANILTKFTAGEKRAIEISLAIEKKWEKELKQQKKLNKHVSSPAPSFVLCFILLIMLKHKFFVFINLLIAHLTNRPS